MFQKFRTAKGQDKYQDKFLQPTVKHPLKQMIWGCFAWEGAGGLFKVPKNVNINGRHYLQVLESKLVARGPWEGWMSKLNCFWFLQDWAPCHRARIIEDWFQEHPETNLIAWPGNSPDLNPIENC